MVVVAFFMVVVAPASLEYRYSALGTIASRFHQGLRCRTSLLRWLSSRFRVHRPAHGAALGIRAEIAAATVLIATAAIVDDAAIVTRRHRDPQHVGESGVRAGVALGA